MARIDRDEILFNIRKYLLMCRDPELSFRFIQRVTDECGEDLIMIEFDWFKGWKFVKVRERDSAAKAVAFKIDRRFGCETSIKGTYSGQNRFTIICTVKSLEPPEQIILATYSPPELLDKNPDYDKILFDLKKYLRTYETSDIGFKYIDSLKNELGRDIVMLEFDCCNPSKLSNIQERNLVAKQVVFEIDGRFEYETSILKSFYNNRNRFIILCTIRAAGFIVTEQRNLENTERSNARMQNVIEKIPSSPPTEYPDKILINLHKILFDLEEYLSTYDISDVGFRCIDFLMDERDRLDVMIEFDCFNQSKLSKEHELIANTVVCEINNHFEYKIYIWKIFYNETRLIIFCVLTADGYIVTAQKHSQKMPKINDLQNFIQSKASPYESADEIINYKKILFDLGTHLRTSHEFDQFDLIINHIGFLYDEINRPVINMDFKCFNQSRLSEVQERDLIVKTTVSEINRIFGYETCINKTFYNNKDCFIIICTIKAHGYTLRNRSTKRVERNKAKRQKYFENKHQREELISATSPSENLAKNISDENIDN